MKATLTQLSNRTLLKGSTTGLLKNSVKLDTSSINVRSNWKKNQSIALSSGVNDSGLFELNFRDERYLPFEGTGGISSWRLEIPRATNTFDLDSISDVVLQLKYSALHSPTLQTEIVNRLKATAVDGFRILNLRQELSTAWYQHMNPTKGKKVHELKFEISKKLLPPNLANGEINNVHLQVDFADGTFPIASDLKISLKPAKTKKLDIPIKSSTLVKRKVQSGEEFREWILAVDRKDGIPANLRRKKDGTVETEVINSNTYYYLDPSKFRNIGLILVFDGKVDWT